MPPADGVPYSQQFLDTTEKVEAFFMLIYSASIYLMGVLSTLEGPNRHPNTPLGRRIYLNLTNFASPKEYKEVTKDKDLYISRQAGMRMKCMLIKDSGYEMCIRHLCKKIRCLQDTKAHLKVKHKARYTDAIHSDDET